jgi:hypothetical protein
MNSYTEAKAALEKIFWQLERINPSAARSLEEGLEETLTVHRLGIGAVLRRQLLCLCSTPGSAWQNPNDVLPGSQCSCSLHRSADHLPNGQESLGLPLPGALAAYQAAVGLDFSVRIEGSIAVMPRAVCELDVLVQREFGLSHKNLLAG